MRGPHEFKEFKVGQRVRWTSHSGPNTAMKEGRIVWLNSTPTGHMLHNDRVRYPGTDNGSQRFDGSWPSYGVLVKVARRGAGGRKLKPYYYGPRPKQLHIV